MSDRSFLTPCLAVLVISGTTSLVIHGQPQQKADRPMTHEQMEDMSKRGDKAMGFDHLKTTHHFILLADGGSIKVEANDATDTLSRDQIRQHLRHITMMFGEGNFNGPMLVHEKTPPGSEAMRRHKTEISYEYQQTDRGAVIRVSTWNSDALLAIHAFLKFQIEEHMTGDPLEVKGSN
jgi:hypothetical protein